MVSFACDYSEGAHPRVLDALVETNFSQQSGYGFDDFTRSAAEKIRENFGCPEAEIFFHTGGTQTNSTIIASLLRDWEGVISPTTGHIAVHEAGAVEYTGHKVLTIPAKEGLISAVDLAEFLERFEQEGAKDHMVRPALLYISFPSEYGTIYTKAELEDIKAVCDNYSIPIFIDGARLGYGLMSERCDISPMDLASLCTVFTVGGTKVGALCGEAVVFPHGGMPPHFLTTTKQHGALLAKGRLLGVQFDTLMSDGLYFEIALHAIQMAKKVRRIFQEKGYRMFIDSPTNQQFFILPGNIAEEISSEVVGEFWENTEEGPVYRFATSWATTEEQLSVLESCLPSLI